MGFALAPIIFQVWQQGRKDMAILFLLMNPGVYMLGIGVLQIIEVRPRVQLATSVFVIGSW